MESQPLSACHRPVSHNDIKEYYVFLSINWNAILAKSSYGKIVKHYPCKRKHVEIEIAGSDLTEKKLFFFVDVGVIEV